MNFRLSLAISLAVMSLVSISFPPSAHAAITAADFCNSPRFKAIVDAVNCQRTNCGDEGKLADYPFICTQVDPTDASRLGADAIRIDTSEDTRAGALTRVNDSYPLLEALVSMRVDPPPKLIELSPCECLATIEAKTKCGIEQCPPEKPAEPPPAPPAEAPAPPKAQTPEQATAGNNGQVALSGGGLCSMGRGDPSQSRIWAYLGLLNGLLLMGWRRRNRI